MTSGLRNVRISHGSSASTLRSVVFVDEAHLTKKFAGPIVVSVTSRPSPSSITTFALPDRMI